MKKFVCKVCGYIYEGDAAPAECPVCHAKSNMFEEVKGELTLAAEHEYGIYAKTVKNNPDISEADKKYIFGQLKANFSGECSEVGMYLCMARIAHREGYPEIGLYWEKAAYEEAEHAAKFAEMLGEDLEPNMKATTKDNLKWRVDCEFGATQGKFDLAKCAKQDTAARSRACWIATSSKMEYTENTVICNCKHVTLADIDNALQRSAHFSDVEKEFAEVQKLTSCSTGCGGCHDKIMAVLSERLSG